LLEVYKPLRIDQRDSREKLTPSPTALLARSNTKNMGRWIVGEFLAA